MEHSDIYKNRVADMNSGKKVNLDTQASIVAEAIAQFTINNEPGEMKSPAQLVYASIGQGMNNFYSITISIIYFNPC